MQVFTATLGTLDLVLFVFCKGKEDFKWLLAVFAKELIVRHVDLRKRRGEGLYSTSTLRERLCQAKLRGHLTGELAKRRPSCATSDEKLRGIRSPWFRRRPPKLRTWVRFPSPAP